MTARALAPLPALVTALADAVRAAADPDCPIPYTLTPKAFAATAGDTA